MAIESIKPTGCRRWERGHAAPQAWFSECGRFRIETSITGAYLLNDLHQLSPSGDGIVVVRKCESLREAVLYAEWLERTSRENER